MAPSSFSILTFSALFLSSLFLSHSLVPVSDTFTYTNSGDFGEYGAEYGADYRALQLSSYPFQLYFYNTTPNAFTLALRLGAYDDSASRRWVWEANRANPVRENATLRFGQDGNLVLADSDGRVVWQTNTVNKGVTGIKLLNNGNIVLHNAKGEYVWQSFDSPTDTLLVCLSLRLKGVSRLVSRASEKGNTNGPYSLVLEPNRAALYYTSKAAPKPMRYYTLGPMGPIVNGTLTFNADVYSVEDGQSLSLGDRILARTKYNATYSYLRLDINGNLKVFTYYPAFDVQRWDVVASVFDRGNELYDAIETECQLPGRCGWFGLCDSNQCVGCPTPNGLMGWTEKCEPRKVGSCGGGFGYYELQGVDHFMCKYTNGEGTMKENECEKKCSKDCKCVGYFYHQENSKCWIAYDLMTLSKVKNVTHLAYIKIPK